MYGFICTHVFILLVSIASCTYLCALFFYLWLRLLTGVFLVAALCLLPAVTQRFSGTPESLRGSCPH